MIWFLAGYVLFNVFVWFLLFDEYDANVRGWQQTNFTTHERIRLALLLPGLPWLLLLVLAINAKQWRGYDEIMRNFFAAARDHWSIIATGQKADYEPHKSA